MLRQHPRTSYFIGLEDPVIGLFLKAPQAILVHSQSWEPLLSDPEGRAPSCPYISSSRDTQAWPGTPSSPPPGLTTRDTRTVLSQLPICCCIPTHTHAQDAHICPHVRVYMHTQRELCILLRLHHIILLFRDCLHFQKCCGVKSQLVTEEKQTKCLKELCSCHRRRGMKSKCLKLLGCFHGKELDLKSVLPALSVAEKRSLGKPVVALLTALVSQMLYWKGQASSSFRERKGVKINGAVCLTLSL